MRLTERLAGRYVLYEGCHFPVEFSDKRCYETRDMPDDSRKPPLSKYRGVTRVSAKYRPWVAAISVANDMINLGAWQTEDEAAVAFDRAARFYVNEKIALNFPERRLTPADGPSLRAEARRRSKTTASSRYLGVSYVAKRGKWKVKLIHAGKRHDLGYFGDELVAARAHDARSIALRGDHAKLNFHPQTGEPIWGKRPIDLEVPGEEQSAVSGKIVRARSGDKNLRWGDMKKSAVVSSLKKFQKDLGRPAGVREIPHGLRLAISRYFENLDAARQAAGIPRPPSNYRWSKESVVDEIRTLSRSGIEISYMALATAGRFDLGGAIRNYFGSIVQARRIAGVPEPLRRKGERQQWDEELVVTTIHERYAEGESIAYSKAPMSLKKAGIKHFGSWKEAVEAAGYDYATIRLTRARYEPEEVIQLLRDLAEREPELTLSEIYKQHFLMPLLRCFGSVDKAIQKAKIKHWPKRVHQAALKRKQIIAGIQERAAEGKPLNATSVREEQLLLFYSGITRFSEWSRALVAAGVLEGVSRRHFVK